MMMAHLGCSRDEVVSAADALLKIREKSQKSYLLSDVDNIFLLVSLQKIPKLQSPLRISLNLPHGMVSKTSDVCLIVKDLDRTDRNWESTEHYYQELLRSAGISDLSRIHITPLKSIKLENKPFEMKRRFALMYDIFIADRRVVRFLPRLLGKDFHTRRSFNQVDMLAGDLKKEILKAMNQTRCMVSGKGSTCAAAIGHTKMSAGDVVDNVMAALKVIAEKLPGGAANIHTAQLKIQNTMAMPIYCSRGSSNKVSLPTKKKSTEKDERSEPESVTIGNARVVILGHKKFKVIRLDEADCDKSDSDYEETTPGDEDGRRCVKRKRVRRRPKRDEWSTKDLAKNDPKKIRLDTWRGEVGVGLRRRKVTVASGKDRSKGGSE